MIKRKIIGRIQLVLGMIILLSSIIGIVITNNWLLKAEDQSYKVLEADLNDFKKLSQSENYSNETKTIIAQEMVYFFDNQNKDVNLWRYNLLLFFSLTIIISILYITQGLSNLSDK